MLSDILPTGFEVRGAERQVKPGDTVAIVGAGPIGARSPADGAVLRFGGVLMIDLGRESIARGTRIRCNADQQQ
jgi:alcohol dehydrogenase